MAERMRMGMVRKRGVMGMGRLMARMAMAGFVSAVAMARFMPGYGRGSTYVRRPFRPPLCHDERGARQNQSNHRHVQQIIQKALHDSLLRLDLAAGVRNARPDRSRMAKSAGSPTEFFSKLSVMRIFSRQLESPVQELFELRPARRRGKSLAEIVRRTPLPRAHSGEADGRRQRSRQGA